MFIGNESANEHNSFIHCLKQMLTEENHVGADFKPDFWSSWQNGVGRSSAKVSLFDTNSFQFGFLNKTKKCFYYLESFARCRILQENAIAEFRRGEPFTFTALDSSKSSRNYDIGISLGR
jgi:hypothetical protein